MSSKSVILLILGYFVSGVLLSYTQPIHAAPSYAVVRPLTPEVAPNGERQAVLPGTNGSSLFTGDFRYEVSVPVPQAKGGLSPNVTLKYSSGSPLNNVGTGWDLDYDYIRRSLKRGVPNYTDLKSGAPGQDELDFKIGSEQGTLVFDKVVGYRYLYRPKREGSFLKFYYSPPFTWDIYATDGTVWKLGDTEVDRNPTNNLAYAWLVKTITDSDNNQILYIWDTSDSATGPLLQSIRYDLDAYGPGKQPSVQFDWAPAGTVIGTPEQDEKYLEDSSDHVDYSKGYLTSPGSKLLKGIAVYGYNEHGTQEKRDFGLTYQPVKSYISDPRKVKGLANPVYFQPQDLPGTSFEYTQPPRAFTEHASIPDRDASGAVDQRTLFASIVEYTSDASTDCSGSPCFSTHIRMTNMLVDVDGDGDLDILSTRDGANSRSGANSTVWWWRENIGGFSFARYQRIRIPQSVAHKDALIYDEKLEKVDPSPPHGYRQIDRRFQDILDMDGDGAADIVYQKLSGGETDVYVCPGVYRPGMPREFGLCARWFGQTWSPPAPDISYLGSSESPIEYGDSDLIDPFLIDGPYRYSWDTSDMVDVNGDRLPDIVVAQQTRDSMNALAVYINSGSGFPQTPSYYIDAPSCTEVSLTEGSSNKPPACIRSRRTWMDIVTCETRALIDMNGDGILDLVRNDPVVSTVLDLATGWQSCTQRSTDSFSWSPGTGRGFDMGRTTTLNLMGHRVLMTWNSVTTGLPEQLIGPTDGQFIDINGDGLPDLVNWQSGIYINDPYRNPDSLTVRFNTGRGFTQSARWTLCPDCQPTLLGINTPYYTGVSANFTLPSGGGIGDGIGYGLVQSLIDLNGDGQVEFVTIPYFGPNNGASLDTHHTPWEIYSVAASNVKPSTYISEIIEDNGLTTAINYDLTASSPSLRLPFPKWVPTEIDHRDSVTGTNRLQTIHYEGPWYDRANREFAGFGKVTVYDDASRTVHQYYQDLNRRGVEYVTEKTSRNSARAGPIQSVVKAIGVVYFDDGNRTWARPESVTTTTTDNDLQRLQQIEEYTYLGQPKGCIHGDPTAECTFRSTDDAALGLVETITYNGDRRDAYKYVYRNDDEKGDYLVRQRSLTRTGVAAAGGSPDVASQTTWSYDGECSSPQAKLTTGRVCEQAVYRGADPGRTSGSSAVTRYKYDSLGRLEQTVEPDGETEQLTYYGNTPYISTRANGLGHTQYYSAYHALTGKPRRTCGPRYVSNPENEFCTFTTYDLYGRPLGEFRPIADSVQLQLVVEREYQDWFLGDTDPPSVTTVEHPLVADPQLTASPDRETITYFNGFGDALQQVKKIPGGFSKNWFGYDGTGRLALAWRPWQSLDSAYEATNARADYSYAYDALDRITEVQNPDGLTQRLAFYQGPWINIVDELKHEKWYWRNPHGEIEQSFQSDGDHWLVNSFGYDAAGRLEYGEDADGGVYQYEYYGDGTVKAAHLPTGSWTFARTDGGKLKAVIAPDAGETEYFYDGEGRLQFRWVRPGPDAAAGCYEFTERFEQYIYGADDVVGSSAYNPFNLGLLIQVVGADIPLDQDGQWKMDEASGFQYLYRYDVRQNLDLSVLTYQASPNAAGERVLKRLKYNALNDVVEEYAQDDLALHGPAIRKEYDAGGRLSHIYTPDGNVDVALNYYPDGKIELVSGEIGDGTEALRIERQFDYNVRDWPEHIETLINGTGVSNLDYFYYPNGNVKQVTDSSRELDWKYYYDDADRLTEADLVDKTLGIVRESFRYHDNGAIDEAHLDMTSKNVHRYIYEDAHHHILRGIDYEYEGPNGPLHQEARYQSSSSGTRCTAEYMHAGGNVNKVDYRWTGDGRLASAARRYNDALRWARMFSHDHEGKAFAIRDPQQGTTTLLLGEDVEKTIGRGGKVWLNAPGLRCVLPGGDVAPSCSVSDVMSVTSVYDLGGQLQAEKTYAPYGMELNRSTDITFGFNEKRRFDDGVLLNYGERFYDPLSRQFLSVDPLRLAGVSDAVQGPNLLQPFAYAAANPTSNLDIQGLEAVGANYLIPGPFNYSHENAFANAALSLVNNVGNAVALPVNFAATALTTIDSAVDSVASAFGSSRGEVDFVLLMTGIEAGFAGARAIGAVSGVQGEAVSPQIKINKLVGDAWRDEVAAFMRTVPGRYAETEKFRPTPFGKRFIDIEVGVLGGKTGEDFRMILGGIETKTGGSPYKPLQRIKDLWNKYNVSYPVNVVRKP